MLLVPTQVGVSKIEGLGVFAGCELKKDDVVWEFDCRCDVRRKKFPKWIRRFIYRDSMGFGYDGDNTKFINHSDTPNLISKGKILIAARKIRIRDELTVDYRNAESLCEIL